MSHTGAKLLGGEQEYDVYARREPAEDLRHIGSVMAPNVALARVFAHTVYDEEDWTEMMVLPRSAEIPVQARRAAGRAAILP